MANQEAQEAVEALAPETVTITAGGTEYVVAPLQTRQFWPILRSALPIIDGLAAAFGVAADPLPAEKSPPQHRAGQGQPVDPYESLTRMLGSEIAGALDLLADHGSRITEIIAVALDVKVSEAGQFMPDETYQAMRAIFQVNQDFFVKRVIPMIAADAGKIDGAAFAAVVDRASSTIGAGPMPSSN